MCSDGPLRTRVVALKGGVAERMLHVVEDGAAGGASRSGESDDQARLAHGDGLVAFRPVTTGRETHREELLSVIVRNE